MQLPSTSSRSSLSRRIAILLIATVLSLGAALQNASAGDALTTSSDSSTTSTKSSLLKSLFSSSSSSSSTSSSSSSQVSRSILGLPIGILKSAVSGVSKAAGTVVSKHIKTY